MAALWLACLLVLAATGERKASLTYPESFRVGGGEDLNEGPIHRPYERHSHQHQERVSANVDHPATVDLLEPMCGDGYVDDGEQCDDQNDIDNDYCSNTCRSNPVESFCNSRNCQKQACLQPPVHDPQPLTCPKTQTERDALGIQATKRIYRIAAVQVPIILNKFGTHAPNGRMFIIDNAANRKLVQDANLDYVEWKRNFDVCFPESSLDEHGRPTGPCIHQGYCDCTKWLGRPRSWQQPLVIRAALCDDIEIQFTNLITDTMVGFHVSGDSPNDVNSDGSWVGSNPSSLASYNERITYHLRCNHQGLFHIADGANYEGEQTGTHIQGLFGALSCLPAGSWWSDPTNMNHNSLSDGIQEVGADSLIASASADIHPPSFGNALLGREDCRFHDQNKAPFPSNTKYPLEDGLPVHAGQTRRSYREYVVFYWDQLEVMFDPMNPFTTVVNGNNRSFAPDPCGHPLNYAELGQSMAISYGSEPLAYREMMLWKLAADGHISLDDNRAGHNEELHHMSWLFGEPATPIAYLYQGDPWKLQIVHGGVKENHAHHLHVYGWNINQHNKDSTIVDVQTVTPGTTYESAPFWGGGSRHMAIGDIIFHCHLYPHFMHGMWAFNRNYDRRQDGLNTHPETYLEDNWTSMDKSTNLRMSTREVAIPRLETLPDRIPPPLWSSQEEITAHLVGKNYNALQGCLSDKCAMFDNEIWVHDESLVPQFFDLANWRQLSGFPNFIRNNIPVFRDVDSDGTVLDLDPWPQQRAFFPLKSPNPAWPQDVLHPEIKEFARIWPAPETTIIPRPGHPRGTRTNKTNWNQPITEDNFYNYYNYHPGTIAERLHMNRRPKPGFFFPKRPIDEMFELAKQGQCPDCNYECCKCPGGKVRVVPTIGQSLNLRYNRFADHNRDGMIMMALENCENGNCQRPPAERSVLSNPSLMADSFAFDSMPTRQLPSAFGPKFFETTSKRDDPGEYREPMNLHWPHNEIGEVHLENWLEDILEGQTIWDEPLPHCRAVERAFVGDLGNHVHLVKFDPLSADGASTGYNYISTATYWYRDPNNMRKPGPVRFNRRMVNRWWADEHNLGQCFLHDHLFATLRQSHGYHSSITIHPCYAETYHPISREKLIQGNFVDVINESPVPQASYAQWKPHRVMTFHVTDFAPTWDAFGNPVIPPNHPGGINDPGTTLINYRHEPLRFRGYKNPKDFFRTIPGTSSLQNREPSTMMYHTYLGDDISIHTIVGAHEETHSFQINGMRWRKFENDPTSYLVNQQTLNLAEKIDVRPKDKDSTCYPAGDYMYKLSAIDDLWTGDWGFIRIHNNALEAQKQGVNLAALPGIKPIPCNPIVGTKVRKYTVIAERRNAVYNKNPNKSNNMMPVPDPWLSKPYGFISDPYAIMFRVTEMTEPNGNLIKFNDQFTLPIEYVEKNPPRTGPVLKRVDDSKKEVWVDLPVLTAELGEVLEVTLINNAVISPQPEPQSPEPPRDVDDRSVDSHISLHADVLAYDPKDNDGCNAGRNNPQTVAPGARKTYKWQVPADAEPFYGVHIYDCADVRNHKHHGAIGAIRLVPAGSTVTAKSSRLKGQPASSKLGYIDAHASVTWTPSGSTISHTRENIIIMFQTGLRLFFDGNKKLPMPDFPFPNPLEDEGADAEHEDQGQKAINFGCEPTSSSGKAPPNGVGGQCPPHFAWPCLHEPEWFRNSLPSTPVFNLTEGTQFIVTLMGAHDKRRGSGFALHGHSHNTFEDRTTVWSGSMGEINAGSVDVLRMTPAKLGQWAYHETQTNEHLKQGGWGIFKVTAGTAPQ